MGKGTACEVATYTALSVEATWTGCAREYERAGGADEGKASVCEAEVRPCFLHLCFPSQSRGSGHCHTHPCHHRVRRTHHVLFRVHDLFHHRGLLRNHRVQGHRFCRPCLRSLSDSCRHRESRPASAYHARQSPSNRSPGSSSTLPSFAQQTSVEPQKSRLELRGGASRARP